MMDDSDQNSDIPVDQHDGEVLELAFALTEGTINDEGVRRLNELLTARGENRAAYMQLMHTIAGLEWERPGVTMASLTREGEPTPIDHHPRKAAAPSADAADVSRATRTHSASNGTHHGSRWPLRPAKPKRTFFGQRSALAFAALAGAVAGSLLTWEASRRNDRPIAATDSRSLAVDPAPAAADQYVATLINVTNCRWDKVRSTGDLQMGSPLRPGESLHLLEGVAQIQSANPGKTTVQLEGPAAMTLTREGMPSLLYGKLTASFSSSRDQFALDTPLGRVAVSGHASIGVTSAPNDIELHVFSGAATLDLWSSSVERPESLTAKEGTSVRARVAADGSVVVDRGKSREAWFVTPAALAKSRLTISDAYVSTILDAGPVAYWRFEQADDGLMRNEIADRLHCRIVGDAVRWHANGANGSTEFGVTAGPGYLLSDDVVDMQGDSYTFETWMKPTYFHHGSLFSLIDWSPSQSPLGSHRLEVELCGPVSGFPQAFRPTEFNPGRIRFIHQTAEVFSSTAYAVRKWQHVAAVKDGSTMRLYWNGELVAENEDVRTVGPGLRVLMGQLFPLSPHIQDEVTSRLFVGELDEVALYQRALSPEELMQRVDLALPERQTSADGNDDTTY